MNIKIYIKKYVGIAIFLSIVGFSGEIHASNHQVVHLLQEQNTLLKKLVNANKKSTISYVVGAAALIGTGWWLKNKLPFSLGSLWTVGKGLASIASIASMFSGRSLAAPDEYEIDESQKKHQPSNHNNNNKDSNAESKKTITNHNPDDDSNPKKLGPESEPEPTELKPNPVVKDTKNGHQGSQQRVINNHDDDSNGHHLAATDNNNNGNALEGNKSQDSEPSAQSSDENNNHNQSQDSLVEQEQHAENSNASLQQQQNSSDHHVAAEKPDDDTNPQIYEKKEKSINTVNNTTAQNQYDIFPENNHSIATTDNNNDNVIEDTHQQVKYQQLQPQQIILVGDDDNKLQDHPFSTQSDEFNNNNNHVVDLNDKSKDNHGCTNPFEIQSTKPIQMALSDIADDDKECDGNNSLNESHSSYTNIPNRFKPSATFYRLTRKIQGLPKKPTKKPTKKTQPDNNINHIEPLVHQSSSSTNHNDTLHLFDRIYNSGIAALNKNQSVRQDSMNQEFDNLWQQPKSTTNDEVTLNQASKKTADQVLHEVAQEAFNTDLALDGLYTESKKNASGTAELTTQTTQSLLQNNSFKKALEKLKVLHTQGKKSYDEVVPALLKIDPQFFDTYGEIYYSNSIYDDECETIVAESIVQELYEQHCENKKTANAGLSKSHLHSLPSQNSLYTSEKEQKSNTSYKFLINFIINKHKKENVTAKTLYTTHKMFFNQENFNQHFFNTMYETGVPQFLKNHNIKDQSTIAFFYELLQQWQLDEASKTTVLNIDTKNNTAETDQGTVTLASLLAKINKYYPKFLSYRIFTKAFNIPGISKILYPNAVQNVGKSRTMSNL